MHVLELWFFFEKFRNNSERILFQSEVFRVLVAITKLKNKERVGAQKEAQRALDAAVKWGIIKPSEREIYEKSTGISTIPEE